MLPKVGRKGSDTLHILYKVIISIGPYNTGIRIRTPIASCSCTTSVAPFELIADGSMAKGLGSHAQRVKGNESRALLDIHTYQRTDTDEDKQRIASSLRKMMSAAGARWIDEGRAIRDEHTRV